MDTRCKESSLVIEARPPRQHAPHIQSFAIDLPKHIFRQHPFARAVVMGASGSVNVVIPAEETVLHWVHPSLQSHLHAARTLVPNRDFPLDIPVLRTATVAHFEL